MENKKKILILYTSIGLGHMYIAMNIGHHLEKAGYEVKLHDILQLQNGIMVKVGEWFHSFINRRFPFIWRWLYLSQAFAKATMWLRVPLAGRNRMNVKQVIEGYRPEMIIATQTSASAPISYMKHHGEFNGLFVVAFSDYHFHPYWFYENVDFYLVNIQEQKDALVKLGYEASKVEVCGVTLKPSEKHNAKTVKQKIGITAKHVVLMSSGSLGIGFPESKLLDYAHELQLLMPDVQVVIVCGKNQVMKQRLQVASEERNLHMTVLGFYEPMSELYAICDLFLTKPGGLTIAEALRDKVNILTTHYLPGQEELNYEYLTEHKLIHPIPEPFTVKQLVAKTRQLIYAYQPQESPVIDMITQQNNEGAVVVKSIKKLFHTV